MTQPDPQWTSDYFRDAPAAGTSHLGRGLVGHVRIVAGLMIAQSILELGFGAFCLFFGIVVLAIPAEAFGGSDPQVMAGLMIFIGLPGLVCGSLRLVAGIFNLRFRRRGLGMIALGIGLATVFTAYCAPTAIALAIYGLIVYVNESVAKAFEMGDSGRSVSEINATFPHGAA
jgi:hypothetical protein